MTSSENKNQSVRESITEAIRHGTVQMRPRWQHLAKAALLITSALVLLAALVFTVGLIVFSLRDQGAWFAPAFGLRGWLTFARALPITLILVAIALIILTETFVRKHPFAYRKPILYTLTIVLIIGIVGGVIATPMHRAFSRRTRMGHPPLFPPFARELYRRPPMMDRHMADLRRGVVTTSTPEALTVQDDDGTTFQVLLTPRTRIPFGVPVVGDSIIAIGAVQGDAFVAFGIRTIDQESGE